MNNFLTSVKADLLDRRLLPLVALVTVALLAAIGYAVLGGGSSSSATSAAVIATPGATASAGLAVSQSTPETAVAETTGGESIQHQGSAHNPFTPLPEPTVKAAVPATSTGAASSSATSGSAPASTGGTSTPSTSSSPKATPSTPTPSTPAPSTPSAPSKPTTPKAVYHVAILFGEVPPGTPAQLTPYENLKLLTPLPSAAHALIDFRGVTAGGKSATFTLLGEAILHGDGACLPSATDCAAIDLQAGEVEQLEYLPSSGPAVTYELKVVSIAASKASSAAVKYTLHQASKAGFELLNHDGLLGIPYLHFSPDAGVLVFAGHGAFGAHAAARPRPSR